MTQEQARLDCLRLAQEAENIFSPPYTEAVIERARRYAGFVMFGNRRDGANEAHQDSQEPEA